MAVFKIYLSDGITQLTNIKNVSFKEAVNVGDDLRPGCVGSAAIEFEVFDTQENAVSAGDTIFAYCIDVDENATLLGKFNCEPKIDTKNSYKVEAYDNASKLNADFSQWLQANQSSFPMTVKQLVQQACAIAGVTLGTASWPLSTQNVQAFYADGVTCRDILSYAAELGGCFVRCHTDGKVYFDWYTANANTIAPSAGTGVYAYKQDGLTYDNYTTAALARVAVHPSGEDDVAYIYPAGVTSGNTLHIKNNLLLTGASASFYNAAAQQVYTAVSAVGQYSPMSVSLFPRENVFHAGDIVSITDAQSVTISAPVMSMMISNAAATLVSEGREYYEDTTNTEKAIAQLNSDIVRINKLKVDWADINTAIINYLTANDVTAQNLTIVDANDVVLATFNASGITIGQTNQNHMKLDFNSLELFDRSNNLFLFIGDEADANNRAYFTTRSIGDGTKTSFPINPTTTDTSSVTVTVDGSPATISSVTASIVTLASAPADGSVVLITYISLGPKYRYDVGLRKSGTVIGRNSFVAGQDNEASGYDSASLGGMYNKAVGEYSASIGGARNESNGDYSVTGGYKNKANSNCTVALGGDTNTADGVNAVVLGGRVNKAQRAYASVLGGVSNTASGQLSSVVGGENGEASGNNAVVVGGTFGVAYGQSSVSLGGVSNKANRKSQVVFGEYNDPVETPNEFSKGTYIEIVGNGTADNARSNARTLDWNGNETLAGGLTTGGGVVSDSYYTRKVPVPSAGTTYLVCRLEDSNGDGRGGVGFITSNNYGEGTRLYHSRGGVANGVALYIDANGNSSVVFGQPDAWRAGLNVSANYAAGDTISFPTSGNSYFTRFHGDWRDTKNLYFFIPTSRSCVGLSATVSGTIYLVTNGVRNSVSMSNVTPTCFCTDGGIAVRLTWSTAPSYAVQYNLASVQPYGFTVTFS